VSCNILESIQQLHNLVWEYGAQTFAMTIPQLGAEAFSPHVATKRTDVNRGIRRLAEESLGRATFVDIDEAVPHAPLDEPAVERHRLWESDGLHMSPQGYNRIADAIFRAASNLPKS